MALKLVLSTLHILTKGRMIIIDSKIDKLLHDVIYNSFASLLELCLQIFSIEFYKVCVRNLCTYTYHSKLFCPIVDYLHHFSMDLQLVQFQLFRFCSIVIVRLVPRYAG